MTHENVGKAVGLHTPLIRSEETGVRRLRPLAAWNCAVDPQRVTRGWGRSQPRTYYRNRLLWTSLERVIGPASTWIAAGGWNYCSFG